jgi:hypothetical protein
MIDSITKEPIRVSDDGDAGPYIIVQLDQVELVKGLLDTAGYDYDVDEDAISFNDQPYTSIVNLGLQADVAGIQRLLDDFDSPNIARGRSSRSDRRR